MPDNIFQEVRAHVTIAQAIEYLRLKATETKGDQLRFPCPKCGGDNRVLSVNLSRGFQCFAGSKKGDDATALVAHCRGIRNGEAAQLLKDHFITATKPAPTKAKAEGRSDTSQDAVRPLEHPVIEMLGINPNMLEAIGGGFDGARITLPLRTPTGTVCMTIGIATRADQSPLLLFSESVASEAKPQPDELRKLFRVV